MIATSGTWAGVIGMGRGDVYPVTYPLAHVGGFKTGLISVFQARATAVLLPVVSRATVVDLLRRTPATILNAPPAALGYVLDAVRAGDDLPGARSVRVVVIGSAIVPPDLVRALLDEIGVGDVVVAYGLTEATGVVTMTRPGDPVDLVCETIGASIEGCEVRISPDSRPEADADHPRIGELEVRGASVMVGYLDDPEATAETMHDGWLRTGDLGWIGDDGYVRIVGRSRDMVIVGGFNVYPAEIEQVLAAHPDVAEAAVVGVPDQRLGEVPVAFVRAGDGRTVRTDDLLLWCRQRLANFKVPRRVAVVDDLPRGAVGKVAKGQLREMALELAAG
jgi:acyl-CoA synthetase (AMP-forming)/AMP-acid ligase II